MVDFTVVVGLDAHCAKYLKLTIPTWRKFQPELFERPWIVVHDGSVLLSEIGSLIGLRANYLYWPQDDYENQRERMLSAHVYVSRWVETEYFLKIDCDAIACERVAFPREKWFKDKPVLVGPSWGYTRAKGGGGTLDEWCLRMDAFCSQHFGTPRKHWELKIGSRDHRKGPKLGINRFVSWLGFQRTDWVANISNLFERDYGYGKLPIPSHDSSLWFAADHQGALMRFGREMKRGWTNRVSLRGCQQKVSEVMECSRTATA